MPIEDDPEIREDCIFNDEENNRCVMLGMSLEIFSCIPDCHYYKSVDDWYGDKTILNYIREHNRENGRI